MAAVHGGYSRHRKALLEGGVQLWELKPTNKPGTQAKKESSIGGSSGASLHTKALTADGHTSFVGSYNLDPRSTWLNCEQGVIVDDPALATQLVAIFDLQTAGPRAWQRDPAETASCAGPTAPRPAIRSPGRPSDRNSRPGWRASFISTPSSSGSRPH